MRVPGKPASCERTRALAERFVEEMQFEVQRATAEGNDVLPRLRCVHERAGHATPEFRTLIIPPLPGSAGMSPEALSRAIRSYAARSTPDRLLLAIDAEQADSDGRSQPVLIAEARDQSGTRLFWMQPYRKLGRLVQWMDPLRGDWFDPGDEEMILDAAFVIGNGVRSGTNP